MRRKLYRYFQRIFFIPFSIGLVSLPVLTFFTNLEAQTYSDFLFDDQKSTQNFGAVTKAPAKLPKTVGYFVDYNVLLGSSFRSQKGGEDREKANRYYANGQSVAPIRFGFNSESYQIQFLISPRVFYQEERIVDKQVQKVGDSEVTANLEKKIGAIDLRLVVGRGYNRLDRFGFFFVGMSNFTSLSLLQSDHFKISTIALRFQPQVENLDRYADRQFVRQIYGGEIGSNHLLFWDTINLFHYHYLEPNRNESQNPYFAQHNFGKFIYTGLDFRSNKFFDLYFIDLTGIRITGQRQNTITPFSETKQSTNSHLVYGAIHRESETWNVSLAGLVTKKDENFRTDSNSNGYASSISEPRVLGGYSSFLLYQTLEGSDLPVFNDTKQRKDPNFENRGNQMFGIQLAKSWFKDFRTDLFINRSDSYMGKGTEVIGKISFVPFTVQSFLQVSLAYANVDPLTSRILITEPFRESLPVKEYIRIYSSFGVQF